MTKLAAYLWIIGAIFFYSAVIDESKRQCDPFADKFGLGVASLAWPVIVPLFILKSAIDPSPIKDKCVDHRADFGGAI